MSTIPESNAAQEVLAKTDAKSSGPSIQDKTSDVARQFEALLIFTMMKSMRTSLAEDTLMGSEQQDMYREMLDREISESIARRGDLGLQKMFEAQLTGNSDVNAAGLIADKDSNSASSLNELSRLNSTVDSAELLARMRVRAE